MVEFFAHHPIWRDFLTNCFAQIIGGVVSSGFMIWLFKHRDDL